MSSPRISISSDIDLEENPVNRIVTLSVFVLLMSTATSQAADVFIVLGQSNGWRISSVAEAASTTPEGKVLFFGMGCTTRPDQPTAKSIRAVHPSSQAFGLANGLRQLSGKEIVFVQYCVCGSSLNAPSDWYPGDDPSAGQTNDAGLFAKFKKYLASARQQAEAAGHEWNVRAVFWHQGESDVKPPHSTNYEANFRKLVGRLRQELGAETPIIAGHIRSLSDEAKRVNAALDAVAAKDSHMKTVRTEDLEGENATDVHFKTAACHELGRRMVTAYSELTAKREIPKPRLFPGAQTTE